jgi:hypothetical protein
MRVFSFVLVLFGVRAAAQTTPSPTATESPTPMENPQTAGALALSGTKTCMQAVVFSGSTAIVYLRTAACVANTIEQRFMLNPTPEDPTIVQIATIQVGEQLCVDFQDVDENPIYAIVSTCDSDEPNQLWAVRGPYFVSLGAAEDGVGDFCLSTSKSAGNYVVVQKCASIVTQEWILQRDDGTAVLPRDVLDQARGSAGWLFLTFFLLVIAMYVCVGCCYKSRYQGTVGLESCPHISFWRDFPQLISDGCNFVVSGGRRNTQGGYDVL